MRRFNSGVKSTETFAAGDPKTVMLLMTVTLLLDMEETLTDRLRLELLLEFVMTVTLVPFPGVISIISYDFSVIKFKF